MKFRWHRYQRKFLEDNSLVILVVKSRRIGISFAAAYRAVRHVIENRGDVIYIAQAYKSTLPFIEDCYYFVRMIEKHVGHPILKKPHGKQKHALDFNNGASIIAFSSAGDALRGRGRNRELFIIDEFAYNPNQEEVLETVNAFSMRLAPVIFISTENGTENAFHKKREAIEKGREQGSVHVIPFMDAINDPDIRLYQMVCDQAGIKYTKSGEDKYIADTYDKYRDTFAQELDCIAIAGSAGSFIPREDIEKAVDDACGDRKEYKWKPAYIGIDPSEGKHDFAITVVEDVDGVFFTREVITLNGKEETKLSALKVLFDDLTNHYNVYKMYVDATGPGAYFCKFLEESYGEGLVEKIKFNQSNKIAMGIAVKSFFAEGKIRIPDNQKVIRDLQTVQSGYSPSGVKQLKFESNENHNDIFVTYMLILGSMHPVSAPFGEVELFDLWPG